MNLCHKIKLDTTFKQDEALQKAAGCARFTWNWATSRFYEIYKDTGKFPNVFELKKEWNSIKGDLYPWIYESPKDANQQVFSNVNHAVKLWSKKPKSNRGNVLNFKKKGVRDSFYCSNDKITYILGETRIRFPVIGWVRMTEQLRFDGKILYAVVSKRSSGWYVSISVDTNVSKPSDNNNSVGVDLGIKNAVVLSDGRSFNAPKPLKRNLKRLKFLCRSVSRKQKKSNNYKKAVHRLAVQHERISNIRNDWVHKITTQICRENQTICVEDLDVKGMIHNHNLAKSISDIGWREIRRQLEYKSKLFGGNLVVVGRFEPTSKACSYCGAVKENLSLSERVFHCNQCGVDLDRDWNAARNINTLGSRGIKASGYSSCFAVVEGRTKQCVTMSTN